MTATQFDVIVVGSGAAGGMAVYDLCRAGLKVLLLEAGRDYSPTTETPMFQTPAAAPLRASNTPDKEAGYYDATIDGGTEVPGEPYSIANGSKFSWWRPRMLGGRTNHWGRVALRFGPYDFKSFSRDGLGFDWPITYDDLAPWYDRVERLIGVTGSPHDLENTPDSPPGILLPPPPPRAHEIMLAAAFKKLDMPVAAIHAAILTRGINGRAPCVYATQCTRGCSSRSNFQSTTVLIPDAFATGNLTIVTNAVVRHVDVDADGKAKGVTFVDRLDGTTSSVQAPFVALAAGAFSSVRILLNSRSDRWPRGIGNQGNVLGRYIMDTVEYTVKGHVPALGLIPPQNDDGIFAPHIYVPWWLYKQQLAGELGFARGYHIEPRGGRRMPSVSTGNYIASGDSSFGATLRQKVRSVYGSYAWLSGEGEMIPNDQTFCELDSATVDKWGVPALRFTWKWSDQEVRQVTHMQQIFAKVFETLGGQALSFPDMPTGGAAVHEVGGARMGNSPLESVVDQFGQCWDAGNLFVIDGATFVSSPDKNPTLTILALAARSSGRILELNRSGAN